MVGDGADRDLRIDEPCGADDLFHDMPSGQHAFIFRRGGGAIDRLMDAFGEFLEPERPVIRRGGEAEAIFDEHFLTRLVAVVHAAHLRQRHMRFVHDEQVILWEEVHERIGRFARRASVEIARIVFNAGAGTDLLQHLDVVGCALQNAFRLQQLALRAESLRLGEHVRLDAGDVVQYLLLPDGVMRRREDHRVIDGQDGFARKGVHLEDAVDLVAEEFHADRLGQAAHGEDFYHIAAHAEGASVKFDVVAFEIDGDEVVHQCVPVEHLPAAQGHGSVFVILGCANAINAGDASHDDDIPPLQERRGSAVPHAVDFLVHAGILFDIQVSLFDVCFRLIIVVIGDEEFHRVMREKFLKFAAKLCSERLVVRQNERRALGLFDDVGHCKGLAGSRDTEQHLMLLIFQDALCERLDGGGLIAGRLELGFQNKAAHAKLSFPYSYSIS